MFALHCKGARPKGVMEEVLERSGRPYIMVKASDTIHEIADAFREAEIGTLVLIEDIDNIEPSKLRAIFDRLDDLQ